MNYHQLKKVASLLGVRVEESSDENSQWEGLCLYWKDKILVRGSLPEYQKIHVLLHELAHYVGKETILNRFTLVHYGEREIYRLVEETIAEAATNVLLFPYVEEVDPGPLKTLTEACLEEGIEWELDVLPEVVRILDYLAPHLQGVVEC